MAASEPSAATAIRDAACVVLTDWRESRPHFLLGRRRATQVFMPNKWVFPGGRVDDEDRSYASTIAEPLNYAAFAVAAIRELYEEAGIALGHRSLKGDGPAGWAAFSEAGLTPSMARLKPLARAITPPGRPRRFDTWFFLADRADAAELTAEPDGELLDLGWFTLDDMRGLDLPGITRMIVDDVARHVAGTNDAAASALIPFYYQDIDLYRRDLIDPAKTVSAP